MGKINCDNLFQLNTESSSCPTNKQSESIKIVSEQLKQQQLIIAGIFLGLIPIISFLCQYLLSLKAGTQQIFFHHLTVIIVDWLFLPFNFFVVRVIDWRRGGTLYLITCISVVLNILTHAFWQYNGADPGHMISKEGIFLPAGWVHLAFSSIEMALLVAFIFCRKRNSQGFRIVTIFATTYFIAMVICGYIMHNGFILSDIIVFFSGIFFVLIYPRISFYKH